MFLKQWRKNKTDSSKQYALEQCAAEVGEQNFLCCVVLSMLLAPAVLANDNEKILFNIPQQRADTALIQFAEQANLTLMVPFNKLQGKTANRLAGNYPIEDAITLLLHGTGLQAAIGNKGQLSIISLQPLEGESEMYKKRKLSLGILAALGSLFGGNAAEADSSPVQPNVEEIVVTGVRGSLQKALDLKRDSVGVVDGIVAEDISKFPDLNLGEALQRVTGITVERQDGGSRSTALGEGSAINVRGLGPSFTRTEINGMTGTNTGQDRGFGFNLLAAELFTQAQVSKSLSASDNEGGLAGTVKLETYKPLNFSERKLVVNANGSYGELAEDIDPRFSLVYADQFDDQKYGVALALAYTDSHRVENMADVSNWDFLRDSMRTNFDLLTPEEQAEIEDLIIPRDPRIMINDRDHKRTNVSLTFQAQPTDRLSISLDNIYAHIDHTGVQIRNDFPIEGFPGTFVPDDLVREGDRFISGTFPAVSHYGRVLAYDYDIQEELQQTVLSAEWQFSDKLLIKPHIGYSHSEQDIRKWNDVSVLTDPTDITYVVQGDFVTFDLAAGDPVDPALYANLSDIRSRPEISQDEEVSAKVDVNYSFDNSGIFTSADVGIRYAEREKSFRIYNGRADRSVIQNLGLVLNDFVDIHDFHVDGQPGNYPTQILGVDFARLANLATPGGFEVLERKEASYVVTEETLALYSQLNFAAGRLAGNVGLRYITTDQTSAGFNSDGAGSVAPVSIGNTYEEVLPSLNARYELTEDVLIRVAAYQSLTRPDLIDIQPGINFGNFSGASGTLGNPELEPFTAANYDLSLEWYFGDNALMSAAYFRKELNGLVERVVSEELLTDPFSGDLLSINLSRPVNGEKASVDGFELAFQTPFTFLPAPLDNLGIVLNYTTTDSKAVFQDEGDIRSSQLPGLSDASYNAILYYDDGNFSLRGAYNWRSDYLLQVTGSGGLPTYRDDYGQLDLSASYAISGSLRLKLDVINVLGEQLRTFSNGDEAKIKGLVETGYQVVFGLTYQL